MLPTLAERLRKQARSGRRGQARQPWPVPGDPPTALLFRPQPVVPDCDVASPQEPAPVEAVVSERAEAAPQVAPAEPVGAVDPVSALSTAMAPAPLAPVDPEPRRAQAPLVEGVLLLLWAVVVVADGALALSMLLRGAGRREQKRLGTKACVAASAAPRPCEAPGLRRGLLVLPSPAPT